LSLRANSENMSAIGEPAIASIPIDGTGRSAVTLDLDPYYASVPNLPLAFVRKPTVPPSLQGTATSQDAGYSSSVGPQSLPLAGDLNEGGARASTEDPPLSGRPLLPTLVPMPPPKFTTRDPLSYAPLIDISSSPSKTPRRHPNLAKRLSNTH
jgi:hypothetical protein